MKDKQLRQQLADCLLYYKKLHDYRYERPYKEVRIRDWDVSCDGYPSVQDLINECNDQGYRFEEVFVDGYSIEDWDGCPEYHVTLDVKLDMSDKEWFDDIASSLSPEWQYDRYKQYIEMEKEFK
jgi:hypothetical protein